MLVWDGLWQSMDALSELLSYFDVTMDPLIYAAWERWNTNIKYDVELETIDFLPLNK